MQVTQNKITDKITIQTKSIANFLFALKAPESKRQYPRRLKLFLDYGVDKRLQLEEQADLFLKQANKKKNGSLWATNYFIQFLNYQKERAQRGDISESTIPNYYKAAKLFCVMNDVILNWVKIGKGVPYEKKAADDRPPTFEEVTKLLEYPDKRIKGFNESEFRKKFDRYYGKRSGSTHGRFDITNHEKKSLAELDIKEVKSWAREILDDFIDRNQTNQTQAL